MEVKVNKFEEIWTKDDKKLGIAQYLFHRENKINPDLQLYATYLEVEDFKYGEVFYVPTVFIAEGDVDSKKISLNVSFDEVMKRTWFRMPDFVVRGESRKEELPLK